MPEKRYKFGLVTHSMEVVEAVRTFSDNSTEELIVELVDLDEAVPTAEKLLREGAEVILGHGGTGTVIIQKIGHRAVNTPRLHIDIIYALLEARNISTHLGLTSFTTPTEGIDILGKLLGVQIRQIVYTTTEELEYGVQAAIDEGTSVIVGGGVSRKMAVAAGGRGIIIRPNPRVVHQALCQARAIALARRLEKEQFQQFRNLFQILDDGVIGVDSYGRMNFCNPMAERILGIDSKDLDGQSLSRYSKDFFMFDVLTSGKPQTDRIVRIANHNLVVNTLPIRIESKTKGAVALFKEAAKIQNTDRKLRETLYIKGFVARYSLEDIKGRSPRMLKVLKKARKYAQTEAAILIEGETGTGKELLAHAIHNLSRRSKQPFVAINCGALPESLLESELFGYEEGAFTGAKKGGKIGLFELANGGTIFLDEIADISLNLQIRLLRVLEAQEVMRVGGDKIVPVDTRLISSTYKDLGNEIDGGNFRVDLFFRIAVLKLKIAPLRERPEDIGDIVLDCLEQKNGSPRTFSQKMIDGMRQCVWPGNIRELKSLIESYLILLGDADCDEALFFELLEDSHTTNCLPGGQSLPPGMPPMELETGALKDQLETCRQMIIQKTLRECHFNKTLTAKKLGISVNTLWRNLRS